MSCSHCRAEWKSGQERAGQGNTKYRPPRRQTGSQKPGAGEDWPLFLRWSGEGAFPMDPNGVGVQGQGRGHSPWTPMGWGCGAGRGAIPHGPQ